MNKLCPYCTESVQTKAKVCPHCRQWLSIISLRNPAVFILIFTVSAIVFLVSLVKDFRERINAGVDFSLYRNRISVTESHMTFNSDEKAPLIYVVIVLTNKSDLAWKDVDMDLRFYDKSGSLIDAMQGWSSGVIYPSGDFAFRVKETPNHPFSDYDSYKIFIRSARDARSLL